MIHVITMTNTQTYQANRTEAQDLLNRIAQRLNEAKDTESWSAAGSLGQVNVELAQILAFLGDRSAVDAKGISY